MNKKSKKEEAGMVVGGEQLLMETMKNNLTVRRRDEAKYRQGCVHPFKIRKKQFNIFL